MSPIQISERSAANLPDHPGGVIDLLLDCHGRIRHFLTLAERLADAPPSTPPSDLSETAAAVRRYFTVALPLHVADEDRSISPRLRARAPAVAALLDELEVEHAAIEGAIAVAAPLW